MENVLRYVYMNIMVLREFTLHWLMFLRCDTIHGNVMRITVHANLGK